MATINETLDRVDASDLSYEAKEIVRTAAALAEQDFYYGPAETKLELIFAYLKHIEKATTA